MIEKDVKERKLNNFLTLKNSPALNKYNFVYENNKLTLNSNNKDLDEAKKNGLTINQLLMGTDFQKRINNNLEIKKAELNDHLEVVSLKRRELTRASQKKRVFEILKEKEIKQYELEKERLERMEVDEIAQNYKRFSKIDKKIP